MTRKFSASATDARLAPQDSGDENGPSLPAAPVFSRLFSARQVLLFGEVTMDRAHAVTAQLLALATESREPITLVVHSPGGHVESADTIFDVIRFIDAPVTVLGSGWVASAGALIFVAAQKTKRVCLPNTRFLLHQPLGGVGGPATDVEIEARQITLMRERLNRIFAEATGQPLEKILKDTDRNYWLSAEEAREYGLVDRIVTCAGELG
jgi:ATP-dependent Clp protease protease subunit